MTQAGVLRVDKPEGPTSHDVVAAARRALAERRIGHTGTLDPFATGLLLLCVGPATRLAPFLTGLPKRYHAVARLGVATTTDDATGDVVERADVQLLDPAAVRTALEGMVGELLQRPPAFSAKKVAGRRAYEAARAGVELELPAVPVTIHHVDVLDVRLPEVEFQVDCSSGTYIRAIARDLGAGLGVGAHLTALRRTAIGEHRVEGAIPIERLGEPDAVQAAWLTPLQAMAHLPKVELDDEDVGRVKHGVAIEREAPLRADGTTTPEPSPVVLARGQELIAIAEPQEGWLKPRKVFA